MDEAFPEDSRMNGPSHKVRSISALAISVGVPLFFYIALALALGDNLFPFSGMPPGREARAALAIRDNESSGFKWGTRMFTEPYLHKYYAEYWYFTQMRKGDCETEFKAALEKALNKYPNVDLFLLAHTNKYIKWVESLPESLRSRIRFVYNTGCHNEKQGADWLALGADTYIGHPGKSQSPYFYFFLMRHWTHGDPLDAILKLGNHRMFLKFRQLEWLTLGRFNAEEVMKESVASCVGNTHLRIGDGL